MGQGNIETTKDGTAADNADIDRPKVYVAPWSGSRNPGYVQFARDGKLLDTWQMGVRRFRDRR